MKRLDAHLQIDEDDRSIQCSSCGETICDATANYKRHVPVERNPLEAAGPLVNDPSEYVDDEMEFRQYYCPGCATLLENEVILAELDPIHDKELILD